MSSGAYFCDSSHEMSSFLMSSTNCTLQLYKEITCPLDNFELVLFSLAGPDGKSYPLCPYCYSNPPFEGAEKLFGGVGFKGEPGKGGGGGGKGGMPCTLCPHPTCRNSMIQQGVCACPECDGTLVLDPVSAPKWRLDCNKCSNLVYLPHNAHKIAVCQERCDDCGSALLEVRHKLLMILSSLILFTFARMMNVWYRILRKKEWSI